MVTAEMQDLSEQWVEGRDDLRWRTKLGTTPDDGTRASSTCLVEVEPGCALPRHTDSAEVEVDGETGRVGTTYEDEVQPSGERRSQTVG